MFEQNKPPFFSIVMVNYNGGGYLEMALQSIFSQSCKEYELIVVDGSSTDNSVDILKKYDSKIDWWVSEKDNGQSNAFNKGFMKAKGLYFLWLNTDDVLLPESLKFAKTTIEKYSHYKWFVANTIFFNQLGIIKKCSKGLRWNLKIAGTPINVSGPSSIFHRDLFFEHFGFDESLHYTMDTDLWMRFKNSGYSYKRINRYFWGFRLHSESKTFHAFDCNPNDNFQSEREKIQKKNNYAYSKKGLYLQFLVKLISGTFLRSYLDSLLLKNKNIKAINLK